jgi:chemotaxis protein methyltransferase CheR
MRFEADALGLSETGVSLLRDLIHDKTGLFYDDGRRGILVDKLAPLVVTKGFDSFLDYYYLLRYDPSANGEWGRVVDALSVPETYFWREVDQIQAVVKEVVPLLVRQGARPLRIWSVPCSSGEEPLTIAILLNEAGWFDRAPIAIYGSDASPKAVRAAREGLYRERSFRAMPPSMREKYFTREGETWRVDEAIAARVQWNRLNLFDRDQASRFASVPVIFCRNLLIYFSEQSLSRAVSLFADFMPTPGYLCLGASESLLRHTTRFELQEFNGAYLYVKR